MQYIPIALSQPPGEGGKAGGEGGTQPKSGIEGLLGGPLPMLILLFAIFYFLLIRPQQQRQKQQQKLISELQKGDAVVTAGGIHGVISVVKEGAVTVKIAENVKVDVERSSITKVTKKTSGSGEAG